MPAESLNIRSLFDRALELASDAQRQAYLDQVCAGIPDVRQRIDALLQAHDSAGSFLEHPALAAGVAPAADQARLERPGALIGPYKLLQQIGEGGMGTVWMAEQVQPVHRKVALKIVKPGMDSRQVLARLEAERQALALMDHANIAKVLDAGATDAGRPYFVMELVKGQSITTYCDEHRLTPRQRIELFLPVCQAIQHAHQKGIIHRDIKPSNVLVAPYDGRPVVKVIDFSVVKATGQRLTEKTLFTEFGAIVGTLEYMSPEQAELNNQDIDTRSDIYSLGVLLYELLTGTTPLIRQQLQQAVFTEMLRVIREEEPPRPSTRLSESKDTLPAVSAQRHMEPARLTKLVRGELDWIVMKALEKDRNRRYETANSLAVDLRRYLNDEAVLARPPSRAYLLRKFVQRNRGPVLSVFLLLLALVSGIVGTTWGLVGAEQARRTAVSAQLAEARRAQGERLAKEEAQKRLAQIEKATETLVSMIRDVDPLVADKEGVTTRVLLGRRLAEAAHELEGEAVGDPLVVARLQHAMGISLQELGHRKEAEAVLVKACQTRERLLGAANLDTAATRHHLAMLYRVQAKYDLAETLFKAALESRLAQLGAHHADTLHTQQQLAMLYHAQRKFDLAEAQFKQVLELRSASLAADHPDTLASQHRLAMLYRSQGKLALAESLCEEVLALRTARLGADNLDTLASKQLLAVIYRSQGKLTLAEPLYKEVFALRTAKLGNSHPDTLGTQHHLALVYRSLNRFDLSIPLLEETLKLRNAKLGPDHPSTLVTQADLAVNYLGAGRSADALALLVDRLDEGSQHETKVQTDAELVQTQVIERLVQLYDAAGLTGTAAQWRTKLEQRARSPLK